jgi:hypothetical protein
MKKSRLLCALCACVFCFITISSHAATISYAFTGVLDRITDDFNILTGQFSVGDTFQGSFSYITNAPEASNTVNDPTLAIYSVVTECRVNINGYVFEGDASPGFLQIWDDRASGSNIVDTISASSPLDFTPPIPGMGPGQIVASSKINLFDYTNTALSSIQVPTGVINLSDFDYHGFSALQLNTDTDEVFHLNGVITSLEPVPIPATAWLFGSGLLGLISMARKKVA